MDNTGIIGLVCSLWLNVVKYTILFYVLTYMHNELGMKRIWHLRTYLNALGITLPLVIGWNMIAPISGPLMAWFLAIKFLLIMTGPIQELRDLDGDLKSGRRSFPIVFGERFTKRFLVVGAAAFNIVLPFVLSSISTASHLTTFICQAVLCISLLSWCSKYRKARRPRSTRFVTTCLSDSTFCPSRLGVL